MAFLSGLHYPAPRVNKSGYSTEAELQSKVDQVLRNLHLERLPETITKINFQFPSEGITSLAHVFFVSGYVLNELGRWRSGYGRQLDATEMAIIQNLGFDYTAEQNSTWPIHSRNTHQLTLTATQNVIN